mmetsp:Transcript_6586/g.10601  ORF Transcript_6586/g.10601 Transcript_6586/m.10601 type:complete len:94 (-) Transcript_6586:176-457(-)
MILVSRKYLNQLDLPANNRRQVQKFAPMATLYFKYVVVIIAIVIMVRIFKAASMYYILDEFLKEEFKQSENAFRLHANATSEFEEELENREEL